VLAEPGMWLVRKARWDFLPEILTMKVHARLAMELARHSDVRLTMKTYFQYGFLPTTSARFLCDFLPAPHSCKSFSQSHDFSW
jgi:hypothetical protein